MGGGGVLVVGFSRIRALEKHTLLVFSGYFPSKLSKFVWLCKIRANFSHDSQNFVHQIIGMEVKMVRKSIVGGNGEFRNLIQMGSAGMKKRFGILLEIVLFCFCINNEMWEVKNSVSWELCLKIPRGWFRLFPPHTVH